MKLKLEYQESFSFIEYLSTQKFENFNPSDIAKVIEFYKDDKIEKELEEN